MLRTPFDTSFFKLWRKTLGVQILSNSLEFTSPKYRLQNNVYRLLVLLIDCREKIFWQSWGENLCNGESLSVLDLLSSTLWSVQFILVDNDYCCRRPKPFE